MSPAWPPPCTDASPPAIRIVLLDDARRRDEPADVPRAVLRRILEQADWGEGTFA